MGACRDEEWRSVLKITDVAGEVATIPVSDYHRDGSWLTTDIYIGELLINETDGKLFTRTASGIKEISIAAGGGIGYRVRRQLTNAEILALFTTPIEIIPTPGAGKMAVPIIAYAYLDHNGTTYTSGNRLKLKYFGDTDANYIWQSSAALINSAADLAERLVASTKQGLEFNTAVMAFVDVANPTGAGGTIDVVVYYQIIDFTV